MSKIRLDRILVVDFEETCWEGPPPAGQEPEIIQIGIAELDIRTRPVIVRQAGYLVRPRRSEIGSFCTALTGITPEMAHKEGRWLSEVLGTVRKAFGGGGKSWAGFGRDDKLLARNCMAAGGESPFSDNYLDIAQLWGLVTGGGQRASLEQVMAKMKIELPGRSHDAEVDAVGAAMVLSELVEALRRDFGMKLPAAESCSSEPASPAP